MGKAEIVIPRRPGRPRVRELEMPKGMRIVRGRWYWRPTDELTRLIAQRIAFGKLNFALGKSETQAREWYVENVLRLMPFASPVQSVRRGREPSMKKRARMSRARARQWISEAPSAPTGLVYFLRSELGYIKVGYTTDAASLRRRVADLRGAHPGALELLDAFPGSLQLERACHCVLHDLHQQGEWFEDHKLIAMLRERAHADGLALALRFFVNFERGNSSIADKLPPLTA
jgi:hypothetical protein